MGPLVGFFVFCGCATFAQGPAGNRATGVVYEKSQNGSAASNSATVWIFNRDSSLDDTNGDGLYYIVIPSDVAQFELRAKKKGFQTGQSERPYSNQKDPIKAGRITLEPEPPKSPNIRQIVDREIEVLSFKVPPKARKLIVEDLRDLSKQTTAADAEYIKKRLAGLPQ